MASLRTRNNAAGGAVPATWAPPAYDNPYGFLGSFANTSSRPAKSRGPLNGRPSSPKVQHFRQAHLANSSSLCLIRFQLPILIPLTLVALLFRLYKLGQPSSVVFDEVHFGGFATKYIKRKFFMDVHPPLAKLLIAGTAKLAGFDGSFPFKEIAKYVTLQHRASATHIRTED